MGTEEGIVQFSVASVVEDVLQQGKRLSDIDFASRKAEEACMFIYLIIFSLMNQLTRYDT